MGERGRFGAGFGEIEVDLEGVGRVKGRFGGVWESEGSIWRGLGERFNRGQ